MEIHKSIASTMEFNENQTNRMELWGKAGESAGKVESRGTSGKVGESRATAQMSCAILQKMGSQAMKFSELRTTPALKETHAL